MDVFDKNGVQRDMAWLRQKYGNVQFLDAVLALVVLTTTD